ncbi:hypothetical protein EJ03DRAFT_38032 [Teratosphaeria nubilosa]|uniref:Uncharacterized protein n=1 Tax=Teratosphaeria nubilosa TaxID=161662 RepID=A0A6G1LGJ1_9PEZI|nr:hypothetical protein EJ03DRAFT_38032 [Teratosphaeria nubilosa]
MHANPTLIRLISKATLLVSCCRLNPSQTSSDVASGSDTFLETYMLVSILSTPKPGGCLDNATIYWHAWKRDGDSTLGTSIPRAVRNPFQVCSALRNFVAASRKLKLHLRAELLTFLTDALECDRNLVSKSPTGLKDQLEQRLLRRHTLKGSVAQMITLNGGLRTVTSTALLLTLHPSTLLSVHRWGQTPTPGPRVTNSRP